MLKMQEKITRRRVLGLLEEAVLGASAFIASGCATRKKQQPPRRISMDFPKATPARPARIETESTEISEGDNEYTTRMLYSYQRGIWLRESNSATRKLTEGEIAQWGSEFRFLFKRFEGVNKVSVYDINSGNVEVSPNLETFPVTSPNGKNFLQVINGGIINSNWLEGNRLFSFFVQDGSSPIWVTDESVLYVSKEEALKLCGSGISSSNRFSFSRFCRGFDVSRDRKNMVYAETCPSTKPNEDSVKGYTQLCLADLGKVREKIGRNLDIVAEELFVKNSDVNDSSLREFLGPKISPNGKNIAFAEGYGKNLENMNVWVYNREEKDSRDIKLGLRRDPSMPYERTIEWLDDSENLAVSYKENRISVVNIHTRKSHTFSGKNVSVYHE